MTDKKSETAPTLFHVEEQEVFYWVRQIDAANKDLARIFVFENGRGEVVGHHLVSKLVTNIHPVTDKCAELGCYQQPDAELDKNES